MAISIASGALIGLECVPVEIETDIDAGLPRFSIVGLPDTAVQESRERVRAAIKNCGFAFPRTRITVNLAPADVKKEGPLYDFPIAASILLASGTLPSDAEVLASSVLVGELALDGALRGVTGVLPLALMARALGIRRLFLPEESAAEAAIVGDLAIYPIPHLLALVDFLTGKLEIAPYERTRTRKPRTTYAIDFASIAGQAHAKRALEIAAAGGHNVLLRGLPGAGKTLLARALPSILPPMTAEEALEVTTIWSIAGLLERQTPLVAERPFRSPHHSASAPALVGGGPSPRPGEVSLAHHGVLFLDEFPEFKRHVLEQLRQPLEDGYIAVARALRTTRFPARFMLVAAQNPCPCGFFSDRARRCTCSPADIARYQKKLSGPLLDRIDLVVEVPALSADELTSAPSGEPSGVVRRRVLMARERQMARNGTLDYTTNSSLAGEAVRSLCVPTDAAVDFIKGAIVKFHLSARGYHRLLKVARTIADLAGDDTIDIPHIAEALGYRPETE